MLDINDFRATVRNAILQMDNPKHGALLSAFEDELKQLIEEGKLGFKPDYLLGGKTLEIRVMKVLQDMTFDVRPGRSGMEDFVVCPPADLQPKKKLVVEVKSSKSSGPNRDDLRQLDDWVFDLSGEETARKFGLQNDYLQISLFGGWGSTSHHPSPHKGVLVFNGLIGTRFEERPDKWLNPNEEAFAAKRDFCIISFPCLICWYEKSRQDTSVLTVFWKEVHSTRGVLRNPE